MKTSEFIEKLNKHQDKINGTYIKYFSNDVFEKTISTDQFSITYRNNEEPNGIIDIIAEYLNTPVSEREEEKRYYLKLKGFDGEQPYLCAYDFWNAWILIEKDSFTHGDEFYFKFTEENIKNLPEELKAHNWEQIEVGVRVNAKNNYKD